MHSDNQTHPFTFDGRPYTALPGDTIGSALLRNGVEVLSRSFKYHRPRGLMCCAGHCPNCLVQVEDEPSVRACMTTVEPGMEVRSQNAWPSLRLDVMSLTRLIGRFLPVGFYYKTFTRPRFLWPLYEKVLRSAAGLGRAPGRGELVPGRGELVPERGDLAAGRGDLAAGRGPLAAGRGDLAPTGGGYGKQYHHVDVAVVGGGRAGLEAALAAAEAGASVLLLDENPTLGGRLRYATHPTNHAPRTTPHEPRPTEYATRTTHHVELLTQIASVPNLRVMSEAAVIGWWEDNWLAARQGKRLHKIRAQAVVFATGAYEQPLLFENNDLPGIMLGGGVQRLIKLHGLTSEALGRRAVVVTTNDEGWAVAADLLAAGVQVAAMVDARPPQASDAADELKASGVPVFWRHTVASAEGSGRVRKVALAPLTDDGVASGSITRWIDCDLVAISAGYAPANGLLYQAGAKIRWDEEAGQFVVASLPPGIFAAGRAAGRLNDDARTVGTQAAAFAQAHSLPPAPLPTSYSLLPPPPSLLPTSSSLLPPPSSHATLCFCEDVSVHDVETAVAEGYDSLELLKRYSTISMGPCQGKMCSQHAVHLCARLTGASVPATGVTTARPPAAPVPMGVLAGQHMEPVQLTPVDAWHRANGAKMMVAGLWMRPEHYGDPIAEVKAVREAVGLIDVSTLGKLRLIGPGVPALLDRLYINRLGDLPSGRARYGVMCNDEGVVLDDGVTARLGESEWYTTTTSSGASAIYEWMQWWRQSGWGDGVHITDVTEDFAAFNLAGPFARAVLRQLTASDVSNLAFPYMRARQIEVGGVACCVLRIGFTGELSYEIHCPAGFGLELWETILEAGREFGIRPFGLEAQRVLRLEKAHIIIGQDTDATSDPLAADLGPLVKLDKPDFLGKRSLVQVAAAGPKQRLVGFRIQKPGVVPEEGLQIVSQLDNKKLQIIGWVTSSRFSPTLNQAIGLCWLPADLAAQPGAGFGIWRDGSLIEAVVHHGPFYDPGGERLRM